MLAPVLAEIVRSNVWDSQTTTKLEKTGIVSSKSKEADVGRGPDEAVNDMSYVMIDDEAIAENKANRDATLVTRRDG